MLLASHTQSSLLLESGLSQQLILKKNSPKNGHPELETHGSGKIREFKRKIYSWGDKMACSVHIGCLLPEEVRRRRWIL